MMMEPDGRVKVTAKESNDGVILAGRTDALEHLSRLLAELDQPPVEDTEFAYVKLSHRKASDAGKLLATVLGRPQISIGVDRATESILMSGTQKALAAARELVANMDQPAGPQRTLRLTFWFVASGSETQPPAQPVADLMPEVREVLKRSGFSTPSAAAPLVIRTAELNTFESEGCWVLGEKAVKMSLKGEAHILESDRSIHLTIIGARVQGLIEKGRGGEQWHVIFDLSTTVVAPLGDVLLLSTAPAHPLGQAIALVIRVEADGP